ncbi:ATP-dependent RNA helicase dhx29 [Geranomyces variabilis]|uniref:RNA helicase n=1 Tax=Geranomyces variabilis TaxID=109894 RepID=A0AAD5XNA1_9FUNG|nr:ATP-dependent RNA helicase dhx29 [Geranomyces variabilis]
MAKKKKAAPLPPGFVRSVATTSSQAKKHDRGDEEEEPNTSGKASPAPVSEPAAAEPAPDAEPDVLVAGEDYDTRVASLKVDADTQRFEKRKKAVLADPSVPALVLSDEAEKSLTDFVVQQSIVQSRDWFAPESSEPSSRVRLHTAYLTLEKLGFSPDAIEDAMTAVGGQDISAMLDWLCLSLPLAQLPPGFTDKKEPEKAPTITYVAPTLRKKVVEDKRVLGATARKQDTDLDMKSWILNNAVSDSGSDSETSGTEPCAETPSQRYARLFLELDQLKHQSAVAKVEGATVTRKELQGDIRTVRESMEAAETEPGYKEKEAADLIAAGRVERAPVPKKLPPITPPVAVTEDVETQDLLNTIFDDIAPPAPTTGPKKPARKLALPIPKDWTGKTPKQLLQEWINRKARGTAITYYEIPSPRGGFRAGVRFSGGKGKVVLEAAEPDASYHAEKKREAEELAATTALYKVASNLPLHLRLPPAFKALWLEWVVNDEQNALLAQEEEGARRMAFVESFFDKREMRCQTKTRQQGDIAGAATTMATGRNAIARAMDMSRLHSLMQKRAQSPPYKNLFKQRSALPVFAMREQIMDVIRCHRVIVISGETGSGKSTQIPQFIVEDGISRGKAACRVVCTQPRRISATSIASRVSEELGDPAGHVGRDGAWVGYQVRLENRTSPDTLLTFCTVGILLKRLESDHDLRHVTHFVIDEVHERSIDADVLMLCLKRILERRADLTVVLMSATADADRFASYFERIAGIAKVPCLRVPGRTFPVTTHFLEDAVEATRFVVEDRRTNVRDAGVVNVSTGGGKTARVRLQWDTASVSNRSFDNDDDDDDDDDELLEEVDSTENWQASDDVSTERNYSKSTLSTVDLINPRQINFELLESLVRFVCANSNAEEDDAGSVLVFLPGIGEIKKIRARLEGTRGMWLLDLHSTLSTAEQAKVFQRAPKGQTKVVLATNIAETGITIPDVTVVIDTLRAREVQFDRKRNVTRLTEILISKANAMQRRGRAGRVREGVCWHLVTRKQWGRLPSYRPPEMVRVPLEEVCLRVRACRFEGPVVAILNGCVDAPPEKNIFHAVESLTRLNAFTSDERLTPLGQKLCHLPLDVRLGKMLLTACALQCVDPVLTIAAVLSGGKSPFPSGGIGERWREFVWGVSDLLMAFRAYAAFRQVKGTYRARKMWCESKDLSFEALSLVGETRSQILRALLDCGVVATVGGGDVDNAFNKYSDDINVVSSAIAAGSFPNVFLMQPSPPPTDDRVDTTPVSLYPPGRALPLYRLHRTSALVNTLGTAGVKELQGKQWGVSYNVRGGDIGVKTLTAGDFTGAHPIGVLVVAANDIYTQKRTRPNLPPLVTFLLSSPRGVIQGLPP